jgi:hypothetical protein
MVLANPIHTMQDKHLVGGVVQGVNPTFWPTLAYFLANPTHMMKDKHLVGGVVQGAGGVVLCHDKGVRQLPSCRNACMHVCVYDGVCV